MMPTHRGESPRVSARVLRTAPNTCATMPHGSKINERIELSKFCHSGVFG